MLSLLMNSMLAVAFGLVSEDEVVELIKSKPPKVELVITGRYATDNIKSMADYVTVFEEVKTPISAGHKCQRGH